MRKTILLKKRPNGRWYGLFWIDCRYEEISTRETRQRAAEKITQNWYAEYLTTGARPWNNSKPPAGVPSKVPLCDDYLDAFWKPDGPYAQDQRNTGRPLSKLYLRNCGSWVKRFALAEGSAFIGKRLDEITPLTTHDWRRTLARIIRSMARQQIDARLGAKLTYSIFVLLNAFTVEQDCTLLARMEAIEALARGEQGA